MTAPTLSLPDLSLAAQRRGLMLILSSPSGTGKTTLSKMLREEEAGQVSLSVSVTTRAPRPAEVPGRDYDFITPEDFMRRRDAGDLLEHAEVYGNFYGTPRGPVDKALSEGRDVLFDIDWQGTQQMLAKARPDLVTIFILPPSMAELERRLRGRAQDSEEVIARRIAKAHDDVSHWSHYDYTLVNVDLMETYGRVKAILAAERLRRSRLVGMPSFVRQLQEERR
jgi:guanylate kinase